MYNHQTRYGVWTQRLHLIIRSVPRVHSLTRFCLSDAFTIRMLSVRHCLVDFHVLPLCWLILSRLGLSQLGTTFLQV